MSEKIENIKRHILKYRCIKTATWCPAIEVFITYEDVLHLDISALTQYCPYCKQEMVFVSDWEEVIKK